MPSMDSKVKEAKWREVDEGGPEDYVGKNVAVFNVLCPRRASIEIKGLVNECAVSPFFVDYVIDMKERQRNASDPLSQSK